jgi:RNA polymerase sigma-70 factor (ECF subfamily)
MTKGSGQPGEQRLRELFEHHARPLLAYAIRRVVDPADAADVVGETFLVAWRRLDDVPAGPESRLWLFGVARRVLANHRRSEMRRHGLSARLRQMLATEMPAAAPSVDVETAQVVAQAMARLGVDERELLRLTSWEGLSPGEIAVVMDVPPGTARSRLHRARAQLRRELEAVGWDDERSGDRGHVEADERVLVRDAEGDR